MLLTTNWGRRTIEEAAGGSQITLHEMRDVGVLLSCDFCKGTLRKPVFMSSCSPQHHYFCHECLLAHVMDKTNVSQCPTCKTHITLGHIKQDKKLASIVELLVGEPKRRTGEGSVLRRPGGAGDHSPAHAGKRKRAEESGGGGSGESGAGAAAPGSASGGGGAGAAAAPAKKERITFRMELPLPAGFPNPFAIFAAKPAAGEPPATGNKKVLVVPYSQTVARNKEYLLDPMCTRAAIQLKETFDKTKWRLELHVGKAGMGEGSRVQLKNDSASLCEALWQALRDTKQTEALKRQQGESGVFVSPPEPTPTPLGTIFVKVTPK
jgi:hypothetical protein